VFSLKTIYGIIKKEELLEEMNRLPGLKPWVSGIRRNNLRFAPGGHSSPGLKAWSFLADFINYSRSIDFSILPFLCYTIIGNQ
jgi:hypothetical protein